MVGIEEQETNLLFTAQEEISLPALLPPSSSRCAPMKYFGTLFASCRASPRTHGVHYVVPTFFTACLEKSQEPITPIEPADPPGGASCSELISEMEWEEEP